MVVGQVLSMLGFGARLGFDGRILPDAPEKPATVVAVTHSTSFLKNFSHAMMLLHGRVVEFDTIENLPNKPKQMFAEFKKWARGDYEDQIRGGGGGKSGCG